MTMSASHDKFYKPFCLMGMLDSSKLCKSLICKLELRIGLHNLPHSSEDKKVHTQTCYRYKGLLYKNGILYCRFYTLLGNKDFRFGLLTHHLFSFYLIHMNTKNWQQEQLIKQKLFSFWFLPQFEVCEPSRQQEQLENITRKLTYYAPNTTLRVKVQGNLTHSNSRTINLSDFSKIYL